MTELPSHSEYPPLSYFIDSNGRFSFRGFGGIKKMMLLIDRVYGAKPDYQKHKAKLAEYVMQCASFLETSLDSGMAITGKGVILGLGKEFFDKYPRLIESLSSEPILSLNIAIARRNYNYNLPDEYFDLAKTATLIDFIAPGVRSIIVRRGNYFLIPKAPAGSFCRFENVEEDFVNLFTTRRNEALPDCDLIAPAAIVRQTMFDIAEQNRQRL